ncbi:MAG TPA: di-heme oxidoredictase family protein [Candidatus Sulfotelmatobacter sp.]|nr:di-heme oxidoredictase family protein [Candidatus Sulfotelmatobacter sp.]
MKSVTLVFVLAAAVLIGLAVHSRGQSPTPPPEASTGFDDLSNGFSDPDRRKADQKFFEEIEHIAPDGLGPLYNAQSCRECHQTPVSGAASQVAELRVGHLDTHHQFQNPEIPINHGSEVIKDRTLSNDRAICPEIQERVPETETVRTTRLTTNTLGDGYVEAVADETLLKIRKQQCQASRGKICGQAVKVPVPESEGQDRIGRFGWKDQHASLLAFAADAYLNEMGITNSLQKTEVTTICNPPATTSIPNGDPTRITEPNSLPDPTDNNLEDIDHFASFMRSLKAPARDETAAATSDAKHGAEVFTKIGCATCHVDTIVTGKSPAAPGGPGLHPDAVENRTIHPYSDFLLHNVGTGDGIAIAVVEHFGRERVEKRLREEGASTAEVQTPIGKVEDECSESYQTAVAEGEKHPKLLRDTLCARNKVRTAPLWGLRLRSRLMHDGGSMQLDDAIRRHQGEAEEVTDRFEKLKPSDQKALLAFLQSL